MGIVKIFGECYSNTDKEMIYHWHAFAYNTMKYYRYSFRLF